MASSNPSLHAPKQVAAKQKKKSQTKLPFKVTKPPTQGSTQKCKSVFSKKYLQALQRPPLPLNRRYATRILANGLLSMDPIPDYLSPATTRNAKESPLLRLPEKIRKRIWEYALGGLAIEIRFRSFESETTKSGVTVRSEGTPSYESVQESSFAITAFSARIDDLVSKKTSTTVLRHAPKLKVLAQPDSPFFATIAGSGPGRKRIPTAFHLPSVCRIIYSETATLVYSLSQFFFVGEVTNSFGRENGPDGALEGWAMECSHAQLNAINTIRPHPQVLLEYLSSKSMRAFKHFYPSLTKIVVPTRAVNEEATWAAHGDPMRRVWRDRARKDIADRIKSQEGDHIEVVFSGMRAG